MPQLPHGRNQSHPDLHMVYKELAAYHDDSNVRSRVMQDLGIDVIRAFLIDPAYRSGGRGHGKVFIVSEAELMSNAAQNSLLKTLEEPPAGVTIILLCSRPDQLLATTLSRCSLVRFNLLPAKMVTDILVAQGTDPTEAAYWAALTGGSIGESTDLAAQGLYEIKTRLLDRLASMGPAGDADLPGELVKTMESLAKAAASDAKKSGGPDLAASLANRRAVAALLSVLVSAYRDALAESAGSTRPRINADQLPQIAALADRFSPDSLCEIIDQLGEYERLLWRNVSAKTIWDNVAITCATAAPLRV